jgi:hypothetical protein
MILPDYRHKLNNAETLRGISPHTMKNNKVDLRKQYATVMHYSLIVSLIITICLLRFYPVVEYIRSPVYLVQETIDIEQIEITRQQDRPPPPQRPPIVIEVPSESRSRTACRRPGYGVCSGVRRRGGNSSKGGYRPRDRGRT